MAKQKKVLIVTYYWPPAGGPGVQRVLKFVKYLPDFGWEPIVLTVRNGEFPAIDETLIADIPPGCKVYPTSSFQVFNIFKWLKGSKRDAKIETFIFSNKNPKFFDRLSFWIRQNIFVPDARVGWVPFAFRKGLEIIQQEKPVLIFSSSPPHSLQLAALKLARETGLPWVADLRDPWIDAFWDKDLKRTLLAQQRNVAMEKRVIREASAIVTVSKGCRDLLVKEPRPDVHVIPNGFDPDDFTVKKQKSGNFRIVYSGHISADQNPENFFEALTALKSLYGSVLDVRFYGGLEASVAQTIQKLGIGDIVHLNPYVSHQESIGNITQADVLLLLIPRINSKGIVTGKIYEYLATNNLILGIGDESGDAAAILAACNAGMMVDYSRDLTPLLSSLIEDWKAGRERQVDRDAIARYSRVRQAEQLAGIFDHQLQNYR